MSLDPAKRDELNNIVRSKFAELVDALDNLNGVTGLDYKIDYQIQPGDSYLGEHWEDGNEDSSDWNASWC